MLVSFQLPYGRLRKSHLRQSPHPKQNSSKPKTEYLRFLPSPLCKQETGKNLSTGFSRSLFSIFNSKFYFITFTLPNEKTACPQELYPFKIAIILSLNKHPAVVFIGKCK